MAEITEQAASRRTAAVNAEGKHGTWQFKMVRRVSEVRDAITAASGR